MAGVYIFPGVNTGPQAGEEAALISTLWYQFTLTSPCNILPFTSFNNYQCKSSNKQGGTLPTLSVPQDFINSRKLSLHEPGSPFLILGNFPCLFFFF